jgi:hypothetical protein
MKHRKLVLALALIGIAGVSAFAFIDDTSTRHRATRTALGANAAADLPAEIIGQGGGGTSSIDRVVTDPAVPDDPAVRAAYAFMSFIERIDAFSANAAAIDVGSRRTQALALIDELELHERDERLLPAEALHLRVALLGKTTEDAAEQERATTQLVEAYEARIERLHIAARQQRAALNAEFRTRTKRIDSEADALSLVAGSAEREQFIEARRIGAAREVFNPANRGPIRAPIDR